MTTNVKAVAVIQGDNPSSGVSGIVRFTQEKENAPTIVEVDIKGLTQGDHGFHVHEFGDNTNGCTSAGAHFNPFNKSHGAPQDENRHLGDLGNITASADGTVKTKITDNQLTLIDKDDLGKENNELSRTTGNSGGRVGCGVIAFVKYPIAHVIEFYPGTR
ncbi:7784_t:CDS:2 [Diversispora eburnea]|uniref:Superoxide dismutase [Cu-Zn] n=1 Tax=Diversispora eburnea TaxID=1213867 RepID=A0A9N8YIS2_9GLOM|nr:7784_t:CDS:2 [Diversispora eburnea]